jgi:hypothetical protein
VTREIELAAGQVLEVDWRDVAAGAAEPGK